MWSWLEIWLITFVIGSFIAAISGIYPGVILIVMLPISTLPYSWKEKFGLTGSVIDAIENRSWSSLMVFLLSSLVILTQLILFALMYFLFLSVRSPA